MWDDVVIGKGDELCGSTTCFQIDGDKHGFSENYLFYRVNHCILDTGCTIYKNTSIGIKLTRLINEKKSLELIQNYIDSIILKHIDVNVIKDKIQESNRKNYENGKQDKIKEIKNILNIE